MFDQMFFAAILLTKIFSHYHTVFIVIRIIGFAWSPGNIVHRVFTQPAERKIKDRWLPHRHLQQPF